MPTVNHVFPWMKDNIPKKYEDIFSNNKDRTEDNLKNNIDGIFTEDSYETKVSLNNLEDTFKHNDVKDLNVKILEKKIDLDKCEGKPYKESSINFEKESITNDNRQTSFNSYEQKNKTVNGTSFNKEIKRDDTVSKKIERDKAKWRLSSEVLVTLVILNVAGQGVAVEVISTSTLASLLGYPTTCTLGADVLPCTLTLSCWLRGGTRLRGCGGWLFACCQPTEDTWSGYDNSISSSEWQYKVSPPRLRQVPQRNVIPNVFRRRVDDEVTQVDCGIPSSRVLQKRIIGGREARFAEFPWQAHVRISEFQCGGVLVSQRYVATAAHCVSRAHVRDIVVWLGALDTSSGSHTARKVGVYKKILHPLFQFRMTQPDRYDIALLKLSRPITFTRHIRAICLPDADMELRGRSAIIAGWGKTDATDTHTGTNMLRSATVPILSKEQCITWHQSKQISVEIHSEMICAGHSDGHQDACLGDSGGPLIVSEQGRYYLVGITSAGFGCGVDHQPGIYHNVLRTASWVRRLIDDTQHYL